MFWQCCVACRILVPWQVIKPRSPGQWKHQGIITGPPGNSSFGDFKFSLLWWTLRDCSGGCQPQGSSRLCGECILYVAGGLFCLGSSKPYSSRTWFAIWGWAMAHLLSGLFLASNILSPALLNFFAFPSAKLPYPACRIGQRGSLRWVLLPSYYTGPRVSLDSKSILGCE